MKNFSMDRKRRWNNFYPEKKSSVMISLPSPISSSKEDSFFNVKNMKTLFGVKHARVALIFISILFVMACLYLSFSANTNGNQLLSTRSHCPKLLIRPRDYVAVEPYEVDLKSQVINKMS